MTPIAGNIALLFALLVVILQLIFPSRFFYKGAVTVFLLLLTSLLCLVYSYVISDFSVLNVYNNSHTAKPLLYKITGSWGNHEGSMLLLVCILCFYNLLLSFSIKSQRNNIPKALAETAYLTQLLITAGFLAFLIFTSNPFVRNFPVPENGLGLNPLLQDIGLAMHPPILYIGYIGFSVVFSFAISALIHSDVGTGWARNLRIWVLCSWSFLTCGIGLGSWWAYRELGWGGFWFWDPVENVSLLPWLAATGLYHALIALEKRNMFAIWSVLLAIVTFILSLVGIFLVRSGVITSVHSFASDPARGVFILGFLGFTGLLAFILFAARANKISQNTSLTLLSRETMILINCIFFTTLTVTVLLGTIYPILLEVLTGTRVSVGAPYFNINFNYIALIMLIFTAIAPAFSWGNAQEKFGLVSSASLKHILPLALSAIVAVISYLYGGSFITCLALFVASFLLISIILSTKPSWHAAAMMLGHSGAAILLFGIAIASGFAVEKEQLLNPGQSIDFAGYKSQLLDSKLGQGENYVFRRANFRITKNGNDIATLQPEIRFYPLEATSTLEADIYYSLFSNIYVAVGEVDAKGENFATRIYYKPMVNLIWLGCIMLALAGFMAAWRKLHA